MGKDQISSFYLKIARQLSLIKSPFRTQKTRTLTHGIQFGNGVKRQRSTESMVIRGKGKGNGNGKVHPRTGYEGPKGVQA
jgi:hypothetical protein